MTDVRKAAAILLARTGLPDQLLDTLPVGGGCINDCYQLRTDQDTFFLKVNDAKAFPKMFKAEARGLTLLADHFQGAIPQVVYEEVFGDRQYLLLTWIEQGSAGPNGMALLGEFLARMHRVSAPVFGLDTDNYMGSLPQQNTPTESFADFYRDSRLMPLYKQAAERGVMHANAAFDKLCNRLEEIIPAENPSLVHGDLWSGNVLFDTNGTPVLIDPAVAYSHRECDIAMSMMFGGFDQSFYDAYDQNHPLVPGWEARIPLFQLYPLLVHVILFGGSYVRQAEEVIRKFGG
ncbi:MAG: fructosamine kinase family protein [Chitinophagales bacterium]|nr:fructosamine kinase family protein [Chitinophagales bacterium]HPE98523.1 fructosamine kinase family protein [Chitinophagales bacterium]HQU40510.1 fructosamine kinase family protein [Chitinophagales bacterium]